MTFKSVSGFIEEVFLVHWGEDRRLVSSVISWVTILFRGFLFQLIQKRVLKLDFYVTLLIDISNFDCSFHPTHRNVSALPYYSVSVLLNYWYSFILLRYSSTSFPRYPVTQVGLETTGVKIGTIPVSTYPVKKSFDWDDYPLFNTSSKWMCDVAKRLRIILPWLLFFSHMLFSFYFTDFLLCYTWKTPRSLVCVSLPDSM